jgi:hypothetical protein
MEANMTPKAAKKQRKEEPKPATVLAEKVNETAFPPAAHTVAAAATTAPSKQIQTIDKLKEAWAARGLELKAMKVEQDGKFINVVVGADWPIVRVGPTGGIELPQIRSYPKAFQAAVEGDKLLAKQLARDQKKSAAPAPRPTTPTGKVEQKKEEPTPAEKKQQQAAKIEQQIEQAATGQ